MIPLFEGHFSLTWHSLPLKVLILGYPNANLLLMYWWDAPYPDPSEQTSGAVEVVEEPSLHLVTPVLELEVPILGDPYIPLLERWPLGHPPGNYCSLRAYGRELIAGGCVQFAKCDLPLETLCELPQVPFCKVSKLCLEALQSTPTLVRVTSGGVNVILLLWR